MSKHTPGPWHWINNATDEPFDFFAPYDGTGPSLRSVKEYGENKVDVIDGKTYTSWALPKFILDADGPDPETENLANFRLIAAAPDLLHALEYMLAYQYDMDPKSQGSCDMCAKARAAIALAKGEAQ